MRIPLGRIAGREASAILSQMRVIDTKRLLDKVWYLNEEAFERTRKAVRDLI
jgi:hypothetical protein